MKALTLRQPWGSLLAGGEKRLETRTWTTGHRGRIALHASKIFHDEDFALAHSEVFWRSLQKLGFARPHDLPLGAIVGMGSIVDVKTTSEVRGDISMQEYYFGNYERGRWAWLFTDLIMFKRPIPCRGLQGLWTVPDDLLVQIELQRSQS